jgi:LuxR family maltose regulon positive regulatory protein
MNSNSKPGSHQKEPAMIQPSPKLNIPIAREFLERPRLQKRFDIALSHKVILVSAPAGYGKTVFLSQTLANVNQSIAWLSLDKRDNYLTPFWGGLIMALQKVRPGLGEHALAGLRFRRSFIEIALTELVNEIDETATDLIIVLDNYHEINDKDIHDSLAFLIKYLPPQVRLVISSRVSPPLPLAQLRGRGHLVEIKAADLEFTREETHSFLTKLMGLDLSEELIDSLHNSTEGWIAGLQMAAVSMQGRCDATEYIPAFKGTSKEIMEYLTKEVLEQQEEHIRTFLLQTCILDRLTESLCNGITGEKNSQQILEKLVAANLFLQPIDEEGRWFRYHQLFSDLLKKQLEAIQPDIILALYSRASQWYESQGLTEDAIDYALEAHDYDRAVDLIQHIAFTLLGQDKYSTIQDWVARLPEESVAKNLKICIVSILVCEAVRQYEVGETYHRYAQLMSDALQTPEQPGSAQFNTTRGLLTIANSMNDIRDGNFPKAILSLQKELKSLPEEESLARCCINSALGLAYWVSGELEASCRSLEEGIRSSRMASNAYVTIQIIAALAHIRFARGHLNSAAEACYEAIELGTDSNGQESSVVCYARLLLGEILYQWNSLDESKENVIKSIHLAAQASDRSILLNGNMALARIAIAQGELDAGIKLARRARIAHESDAGERFTSDVFMARLWLMAGNSAAASDYAHFWTESLFTPSSESTRPGDSICPAQDVVNQIKGDIYGSDIRDIWSEIPLLNLIRLRLAQGEMDGLSELLEEICREVKPKGWTNILIEALILKALVLFAEKKLVNALRTLSDVLALTEKEGYMRVYLDEGEPMFHLLQRASSRGIASHYVSKLLNAFNLPVLDTPSQFESPKRKAREPLQQYTESDYLTEPLTKREIEVLELLAAGLANKDIAKKLYISLYTVKNHLHSIYQKLDVDGRARAVNRAYETGLI